MADTPHPPAPKVRAPLLLKLALLACVLAVVPLGVVGFLLVDVNRAAVEELHRDAQILALDDLARTIDGELVRAEDDLGAVSRLFADASLDDDTRLRVIQSEIEGRTSLDHVALFDATGARVAVLEEEAVRGVSVPETLSPALRANVERLHVATGEIAPSEAGLRVLVVVRVRVNDATTGFVASSIALGAVQSRVERLAREHFAGSDDAVFVVDSQLRLVAHPNAARAVAREERHDGILASVTPEMIGPALSQSGEYGASDGTPMLGTLAGMEARPWALVAQIPQSVAYASLERMRQAILATVVGAIVIALLLGLLLARSITKPIAALRAHADALAHRRFEARVKVGTRDELAVLGHALNTASIDLEESEARIKHEVAVRTDLGRYVPEQLVERIVRREADMKLGGTKRQITVLFADVVGFTPLADRLPPEATVAMLNELFTILTQIVFKHDGTVDKFIGDCVMAFWNAPGDQADHVRRALETAEDMHAWLEQGNERWRSKYGVTLQLAIGVHTGEAVVGNIGSEKRMEYTAIGNTVNLAARLEAIARPGQVLVTDAVHAAASDVFEMADAGEHQLVGWKTPVRLWEVRA
ncbi:MAG: HAMP domain-containing protein [Deltaproteobacteria bacterium]|nr:HAMP domain-containing protein [Deltaproteobacteria bacterium]